MREENYLSNINATVHIYYKINSFSRYILDICNQTNVEFFGYILQKNTLKCRSNNP